MPNVAWSRAWIWWNDATVIEMQGVQVNQRLDAHAFQVD